MKFTSNTFRFLLLFFAIVMTNTEIVFSQNFPASFPFIRDTVYISVSAKKILYQFLKSLQNKLTWP